MKDIETIKQELESIKGFKNVTINYNATKDIYDVYLRIKGDEAADYANTKDTLSNIPDLEYQYVDSGIFEIWFSSSKVDVVIQDLKDNF